MNFQMDMLLPAHPEQIWTVFFDIPRIAELIPGCESVVETKPLSSYSATMKQRIGPFKIEVPTEIVVESRECNRHVRLHATGRDRFTGTTLDVLLSVDLEAAPNGTRLGVDSSLQVGGRLATLGYSIVKKKSEELFVEFEKRLRAKLELA